MEKKINYNENNDLKYLDIGRGKSNPYRYNPDQSQEEVITEDVNKVEKLEYFTE